MDPALGPSLPRRGYPWTQPWVLNRVLCVVFDPTAASSRLVFGSFRSPRFVPSSGAWNPWRTQSEADAEDPLSEAIIGVRDPDREPWDPDEDSSGTR
jgi:hypothetical protein